MWALDKVLEAAHGTDALLHEASTIPETEGAETAGILKQLELVRREAAIHTAMVGVCDLARCARVDTLVFVRIPLPPF